MSYYASQRSTAKLNNQLDPKQTSGMSMLSNRMNPEHIPTGNRYKSLSQELFPTSKAQTNPGLDLSRIPVQAKLKISEPNDKYEKEADRVAEQVMSMPDLGKSVQRKCGACNKTQQKNKDDELIQLKKENSNTPEVMSVINSSVQSLHSGGRPLPEAARSFFEPRFGTDFSGVRVHDDARAVGMAQSINARAFTLGHNVVFGDGEYSSDSVTGRKLLAHELTHVVQQNGGPTLFSKDKTPNKISLKNNSTLTPNITLQRMPYDFDTSSVGLHEGIGEEFSHETGAPYQPGIQYSSGYEDWLNDRAASTRDQREFVETTINFLTNSLTYFSDPRSLFDAATFQRLINSWLRMVVRQERIIDNDLNGNVQLKTDLRAAYIAAIRVIVSRMATLSGQSETEIYNVNSGRIPMWAWSSPHHLEQGISTPVADMQSADPLTGNVSFSSNGFDIVILPDGVDASLGSVGKTNATVRGATPGAQTMTRSGRTMITSVDATPRPVVTIQTLYHSINSQGLRSAYGRGHTSEDLGGASELPRSQTLGFHEGAHGLAFIQFVADHPSPVFTGTVDMTLAQFNAEITAYTAAITQYGIDMVAFSGRVVDCVGPITIDQYNQSQSAAGVQVAITCIP